ncbi:MAG: hypothetical protein WCA35_24840 [Kovacikia sp.]
MLNDLFLLLIAIPFILGFITYGIRRLLQSSSSTHNPVTIKVSSETLQQLKQNGYLDPNTEKLKDSAVGFVNWEETKP